MTKIIFSLALFIFFVTPLSAQDKEKTVNNKWENVEKEIWSLEENYISNFFKADHEAILSNYHSQFLGWPDSQEHPIGKETADKFLKENYPEPSETNFKIKREGIRVVDNVVITHYLLKISWIDNEGIEKTRESRLTHTWIKEDAQWKILGGMSNRK
ncbi:calcium/calmodulin dependent protein kinase II Association [bacterium BMS3Abin03]|nr:calcium/calmodulin dependent protein kinase II Association [bacterium BMS3Abin03]